MSLAELLLQGAPVGYAKVQEVLDQCDPRTASSNLRPLLEIGLLVEEGGGVLLSWPPVIVRLFLRQGEDDRLVPPGCIPRAHAGDLVCIQVTAQLPIEVRVLVVSHHGTEAAEPVLVGHESNARAGRARRGVAPGVSRAPPVTRTEAHATHHPDPVIDAALHGASRGRRHGWNKEALVTPVTTWR